MRNGKIRLIRGFLVSRAARFACRSLFGSQHYEEIMDEHRPSQSKPEATSMASELGECPSPLSPGEPAIAQETGPVVSDAHPNPTGSGDLIEEAPVDEPSGDNIEGDEADGEPAGEGVDSAEAGGPVAKKRQYKKQPKSTAAELRLQGRRALCKSIADIAADMLRARAKIKSSTWGFQLQLTLPYSGDARCSCN